MWRFTVFLLALWCGDLTARADVIVLKQGDIVRGTVLQQDSKGVLIQLQYGTVTYPQAMIKSVQVENQFRDTQQASPGQRIPQWGAAVVLLAEQTWATEMKQIPATVIDRGILRHVPYVSFRSAYTYELNIYGDLDNPAGVEIGVLPHAVSKLDAKSNCIAFLTSLIPLQMDKAVIASLSWKEDIVITNGITFEITPPTAEDSYGGWWISVYDEALLEKSRASARELAQITQRQVATPHKAPAQPVQAGAVEWSSDELGRSYSTRAASSASSGTSSGTVYVRGYYRKDGTYVRSHTRRSSR